MEASVKLVPFGLTESGLVQIVSGATMKREKRISLVLNTISISGTALYEFRIWHFMVGVQKGPDIVRQDG